MRIVADRARCEGHGMCEALAPNLFRVGDDGIVEPLADAAAESDPDLLRLVVDSCPVEALRRIP
ncbi:ferredoxin [Nocardia brasiliensis]|uniref:ferredoxin n=1 Tax=Nocardia brasiliensis TaxID=37326 RepID=UPI0004A70EDA|nr:ferredoxin [Nocardia brasiliensis]MBF6125708.1 ferredoxin [Nocardia brasiliensis]MBF6543282.1 ferredoxin [Nocardia brasiliensis]